MKKHQLISIVMLMTIISVLLASCGPAKGKKEAVNLNDYTLEEIIKKAQEEGHVESVGMPDSWANWGDTWEGLTKKYGITHADTDMSSAEELNMFENEKDSPTKDIGDIGLGFTAEAIERGIVQGYKTSYWETVPDWAKAEDGKWMIAYTGVTTFIFNEDVTDEPYPTSWADVRKGTYKLTIGDVIGGATGQANVLATAFAFGGDMDNLDPAFEFWAEMAKAGRIDQGDILLQRIQAGEVQLGVTWSYNALTYRDETPNYKFSISVPQDGSILSGYASVINAFAPHPFAAALAREFIFSDDGQINLAKAGAVPTRTDIKIPQAIQDATIQQSEYQNSIPITDAAKYSEVCAQISVRWEEEIIPLMSK
ncbi:MAG TPA: extracellular solute-binding protein [Brevefilum fermentans]|jgi:putative spermidine/putrescine transport system substrate-binding protein|uniref:ABC-type Fe3+ transport system, periplasmic component n=1 Tax=Candidatus Brevifilum fermentans TaxID=1986204 RepID=A0A1Y6K263_9CHLR|nr:extracellular solute-binding protein [Brevefilum fermentans]MDI9565239.1 extracellular solute-binding protein [Chloroflexota bacterium]SMX53751.1 ABC-type Fe3+ transport system, periplasmic component [Brevefilum fermentans]HOM67952.1 extracellular solute-binding protein [Brevefilum fermentans]HPX96306.1 extracellular solute-binding protein [Brevefilum fermentans]HQA28377.1 extracellular solute-binding protein [Brevefilum fermentans]